MNKQEALKWCAENMEEWTRWPVRSGYWPDWQWLSPSNGEWHLMKADVGCITETEWRAARDKYLAALKAVEDGPGEFKPMPEPTTRTFYPSEPQWNGEGLPPVGWVGEFVEIKCPLSGEVHPAIEDWKSGDKLKCVAHVTISEHETVVMQNMRLEYVSSLRPDLYRPLRTDREKAIDALIDNCKSSGGDIIAGFVVDALDAGKIPGYGKLEANHD